MPLTAAICPSCGGALQVNREERLAVCRYCHAPYVVEEAINKYINYYTTNVGTLNANNVTIQDDRTAQARMAAGDSFMSLGRYPEAQEAYTEATKLTPQNYLSWWG